jgi:hypothetical protein
VIAINLYYCYHISNIIFMMLRRQSDCWRIQKEIDFRMTKIAEFQGQLDKYKEEMKDGEHPVNRWRQAGHPRTCGSLIVAISMQEELVAELVKWRDGADEDGLSIDRITESL